MNAPATLKAQINEDMKSAMRARESARLSTIRMLLAAMKQREVDERIELTDADILAIVDKMIKQRRESIAQFDKGGRPELAEAEKAEIAVLGAYLPQQMSEAEVAAAIDAALAETGAKSLADMGKLMAVLKPQLAGKADMAEVSKLVKSRLSN